MTAPHLLPESQWPADACRGPLLYPCDVCHQGFLLLCQVNGRQVCAGCWIRAGRPWPQRPEMTPEQVYQHETEIRERMLKRGGAFANAVRNSKT